VGKTPRSPSQHKKKKKKNALKKGQGREDEGHKLKKRSGKGCIKKRAHETKTSHGKEESITQFEKNVSFVRKTAEIIRGERRGEGGWKTHSSHPP